MVRAGEIAALVPHASDRSAAGHGAGGGLRGPRLLIEPLRAKARELGFDLCRIVRPDAIPEAAGRLDAWLATGAAGDMVWMDETRARRRQPAALWPAVRSIVVLAMNYGPTGDPLAGLADRTRPNVSVYARHRDYHDVVKGKLKLLASWLAAQQAARGAALKVFVDTAPVMEKPLAQAAGLGWQGKHTNLVARGFGSWLFLGSLFTDLDLPPDEPEVDHCGSCRACLAACPTDAFPAPYQLDARRCISYLTIEHAGTIPAALRQAIGNRVYGCDDCLAVCPWNRFAQVARDAKLEARADLAAPPPLETWLALDDAGFRTLFAGGPIKRLGWTRFLRNLLVAAGNSGDATLAEAIMPHLEAPAALPRAMAVWALGRLCVPAVVATLAARHLPGETDTDVRAEWAALGHPTAGDAVP